MFGARSSWVRFNVSKRLRSLKRRQFCSPTSTNKEQQSGISKSNNNGRVNDIRDLEAYRDLDKLDFMKAARILFSNPPQKKKFGIKNEGGMDFVQRCGIKRLDFHLVQLFFALMPSLAVYLVAQYARSEMKRMDAELELKKKAEEEAKAKEMEAIEAEEKAKGSELLKVKERLEALEVTVKEIVVDKKKQTTDEKSKNAAQDQDIEDPKSRSDNSHAAVGRQATPGSGKQQKQADREKSEDKK